MIFLYYVILGLALLTNWVTLRLRRLPLGRAWEALREDEIACRSLGINVTVTKLTAFSIGAMFGGFAGAFFATRKAFISPESFTFIESAIVLAIVVLGGLGSQLGVALAAVVMIGGLEILRDFLSQLNNQPGFAWLAAAVGDIGQYRMLIFGLALVVMMVLRPRGLVSGRTPSVALAGKQGDRGRTGGARPWLQLRCAGRAPDHALRRADGGRRLCRSPRARADHLRHRAERRRQDDGVQLHHRVLPADLRGAAADACGRRRSSCSACRATASPGGRGWRGRSRTSACSPA